MQKTGAFKKMNERKHVVYAQIYKKFQTDVSTAL